MAIASRRNRRPKICVCQPAVACPPGFAITYLEMYFGDSFIHVHFSEDIGTFPADPVAGLFVRNAGTPIDVIGWGTAAPEILTVLLLDPLVFGSTEVAWPLPATGILGVSGGELLGAAYLGYMP